MVLRLISLSNANVDIFDRFLEDTKLRDLSIRPNTSLFRQRQSEHDTFKEYPALILIFLHAAKLNHVFSLAFEAYDPLPESVALPSARLFVECFCRALGKEAFAESRTRQSPALGNDSVCREQDSRHRNTLGKDVFAECQTLGEGGTRQKVVSSRL
jgi:hypothetical protein